MSLTLLIVFITAVVAGLGFWFYNRRQINSLTETIEDKNAVINSFREHLTSPAEDTIPAHSFGQTIPVQFDPESESVIDVRPEKRYNNRPKKAATSIQPAQQPKQNSEKKNRPKPRRKPKPQQ
jgi:hypothetical protein